MTLRRLVFLTVATMALSACAGPLPHPDACTQPLTPDVANSCVVRPSVLWRGGKPDAKGATALVSQGVGTVVNLEMLHSDKDAFRQALGAPQRSVDYFEVPEWEPNVVTAPRLVDDSVATFIAIVRTQAKPIYVHCRSGQNRTGVMVAAYRIVEEQMPVEQAIEEMRRYNGFWSKQDAQYLRDLATERLPQVKALAARKAGDVKREARFECDAKGCAVR